jgi:hypothetical protein
LNVLGFYNPLRDLIRNGVRSGFIRPYNEKLVLFVNRPSVSSFESPSAADIASHESFDWGTAALEAVEGWTAPGSLIYSFDWSLSTPSQRGDDLLEEKALNAT